MRKTTNGRPIRHIETKRITGFIVRNPRNRSQLEKLFEVKDMGYGMRDFERCQTYVKEAYKEASLFSDGIPTETIIVPVVLKTSKPHFVAGRKFYVKNPNRFN